MHLDLKQEVFRVTTILYERKHIPRHDVQLIIEIMSNFISNVYNPFLRAQLKKYLKGAIDQDAMDVIDRIFKQFNDPFVKYNTEDKRFRVYEAKKLYIEPVTYEIIKSFKEKDVQDVSLVDGIPLRGIQIPLEFCLRRRLEKPGLLHGIVNHLKYYMSQKTVMQNIVQGHLWLEKFKSLEKEITNGIVLPLCLSFDDVETGNAMGSHAGKCSIGVVTAHIPCKPPNEASKFDSIMLIQLFMTKHRKLFGNRLILGPLIFQLNDLRTKGMSIKVDGKSLKIHFVLLCFCGDNLGLNGIHGMVESFSNTYCCRFCYAGLKEMSILSKEDPALFRTLDKYLIDSAKPNVSKTGIKEQCIFNAITDYNLIDNANLDEMHDGPEGFVNTVAAKLLTFYIEEKHYFTISDVNKALKSLDFAAESSNLPTDMDFNYVKKNGKLKMSASECLFFVRYMGYIIGDKIPCHERTWEIYVKLRKILTIVTSPVISKDDIEQLESLIDEHHTLYVKEFKSLTPKFHNITHYPRQIKKLEPLVKLSALRYESFHVLIKQILSAVASKKFILETIVKRYQLAMLNSNDSEYKEVYISYGATISKNLLVKYPRNTIASQFASVTVNGVTYKPGSIICVPGQDYSNFGRICNIYVVDDDVYFSSTLLETIGFNAKYFAHSVVEHKSTVEYISQSSLSRRHTCILFVKKKILYVISREL